MQKNVPSSLAHQRVLSSAQFSSRPMRAQHHLTALIHALSHQRWDEAYQLCWQEFQDMHALFHTASPPFSYYSTATHSVLMELQSIWNTQADGPLITMDAGPNIHLLYRPEQHALYDNLKQHYQEIYHVI